MLKKTLLWGLYLLFAGGLIWAGINRTSATLSDTKNTQTHGSEISHQIAPTPLNSTPEESAAEVDTHSHAWVILRAEVTQLDQRNLVIRVEDGSTITLNPRQWRFAQEHGFRAAIGDQLLVTGFYEAEKLAVVHLRNLNNESVVQIRDEEGHPLWDSAGGGKS